MGAVRYQNSYLSGLKKGIPIALGYLSVSFGFGISVVSRGIEAVWAVIISMTNLTSAGQLAGVGVILSQGPIIEMVLTQLVINLRYSLMGIALTQKLGTYSLRHRIFSAFGITDEIFAVAINEGGEIGPRFMYGLITLPYLGWTAGTLIGVFAGDILPLSVSAALGIAIYSMFVAIVVPPARAERGVLIACITAAAVSCAIAFLPFLSFITAGFSIIICAVIGSAVAAYFFPIKETEDENVGEGEGK